MRAELRHFAIRGPLLLEDERPFPIPGGKYTGEEYGEQADS